MAADGTVKVEVRLVLDTLRQDLRRAKEMMQQELGRAAQAVRAHQAAVSAALRGAARGAGGAAAAGPVAAQSGRAALEQARAAWRAAMAQQTPTVRLYEEEVARRRAAGLGPVQPSPGAPTGGTLLTPPPYLGPVPPRLPGAGGPPATSLAGMVQRWITVPMGALAQVATKVAATLATVRVGLGLLYFAIRTATAPLRLFSSIIERAAESARQLYGRALESGGLPLRFVAAQQQLASALGVSEGHLWQFAEAVQAVQDRFRSSTRTLAETTPVLTDLSVSWRALRSEVAAHFAELSAALAPFVRSLLDMARAFIEGYRQTVMFRLGLIAIGSVLAAIGIVAGAVTLAVQSLQLAFQAIVDAIQWLVRQVLIGARRLGLVKAEPGEILTEAEDPFRETRSIFRAMQETFRAWGNVFRYASQPEPGRFTELTEPRAMQRRFGPAALERMGLVVGFPAAALQPLERTARYTGRIADLMEQVAANTGALAGGLPRGRTTGLNPQYAQP